MDTQVKGIGKRKVLGRYVKEMNVEGWISEFCGKKMK